MFDETDYSMPTHLRMYRKRSKRTYFPKEAVTHGSMEYYNRVCKCIIDGFYSAFGDTNLSFRDYSQGRAGVKNSYKLVRSEGMLKNNVNVEVK